MTKTADHQLSFYFPIEQKVKSQEIANQLPVVPNDLDNIIQTLPALLPHQHLNVLKAEKRFFTPPGEQLDGLNKGILFTDNTGSGKTYTGAGIMNRFIRMNKRDIMVVVPTDAKCRDWVVDAKNLGIYLYHLKDTKDAGKIGTAVVTTYANMRQNPALLARARKRPFDLLVLDESHNLIMNLKGEETDATEQFKAISFPIDTAMDLSTEIYEEEMDEEFKKSSKISDELATKIRTNAQKIESITKVVFLSATPFSYHKNLIYADGFLFRIKQGLSNKNEWFRKFFVDKFEYRVRFEKLTEPDAATDVGKLERAFHTQITQAGVVSSTRMTLDKDYSREFIMVEDSVGVMIDEGFELATDEDKYNILPEIAKKRFNHLYAQQLLEAIKARLIIPRIHQHLALGRKVIIFHQFNNALPAHPFDFNDPDLFPKKVRTMQIDNEIKKFHQEYPQFRAMDFTGLANPIKTLSEVFGERLAVFNGQVTQKQRAENKAAFNRDGSGVDIMVCQQDAAKEGISLHDTSGKYQRFIINLGLPIKPVVATQTEGRIYRIGQKSDAGFEYAVLHHSFEKFAFSKINDRVATVENFAFGEAARNLREAFKEGYKNAVVDPPHAGQGKGSRDQDLLFENIDYFDMAIRVYNNRSKRTDKLRARDGVGYTATPEPLGLKIVEWVDAVGGEHLLEPSAGHGGIARYFPDTTHNKFLEPVYSLRADLAINANGNALKTEFEKFNIINKFNGICMFPPAGEDGKTTIRHIHKAAMSHMDNGARLVAVMPDTEHNKASLKRWMTDTKEWRNLFLVTTISIPAFVYGEHVYVIIIDKSTEGHVEKMPNVDLTHCETIEQFWTELRGITVPKRKRLDMKLVKRTDNPFCEVISGVHTKYGHDIWTVKIIRPLTSTQLRTAIEIGTQLRGKYSTYDRNGAVPGIIFSGARGSDVAMAAFLKINNTLATAEVHA